MTLEELKRRARAGGGPRKPQPPPRQRPAGNGVPVGDGRKPPVQSQQEVPTHSVKVEKASFVAPTTPTRWWQQYSSIQGTQGYRSLGQTESLSPLKPLSPFPEGYPRVKLREESPSIRRLFRPLSRNKETTSGAMNRPSSSAAGRRARSTDTTEQSRNLRTSLSFSAFENAGMGDDISGIPEFHSIRVTSSKKGRPQSARYPSRSNVGDGRWEKEIMSSLSSGSIDERARVLIENVGVPDSDIPGTARPKLGASQRIRPRSASAARPPPNLVTFERSEQGKPVSDPEFRNEDSVGPLEGLRFQFCGSIGGEGSERGASPGNGQRSRGSTESPTLRLGFEFSRQQGSPLGSRSKSPMARARRMQSPLQNANGRESGHTSPMQWVEPAGRPDAARRSSLPAGAFAGPGSPSVTKAAAETRRAQRKHVLANESPPRALIAMITPPQPRPRSNSLRSRDRSPQRSTSPERETPKGPVVPEEATRSESSAGKGIVRDTDERCKPGTKVRLASSFKNEDWAKQIGSKIGRISAPAGPGVWNVKFQGQTELVECCCGLMGRHHLVYAEEDLEDSKASDPWKFGRRASQVP